VTGNPGQIAYEAYAEFTGGRSLVSGAALPPWPELPEAIRHAWDAAAVKVLASR
jgi:hypothetical protein